MKKSTSRTLGMLVAGCWLATGVVWAKPPFPVPAKGGLPVCKAELAICNGDLDSCDLALGTCTMDLTTCNTDLGTCTSDLNQTTAELATCTSELATCESSVQAFPATGQTLCVDSLGEIDCAGTGQDGDIKAGSALSYTDTGLTIIDNNTQLEWMKQDDNNGDCGSYPGNLDKDCFFNWDGAFAFVASLNAANHAGHDDWRVPNVKELMSIVNYQNLRPAISEVFNNAACVPGCTVETCSCTPNEFYWSSTVFLGSFGDAMGVLFSAGEVTFNNMGGVDSLVRAVRGGL